MKRRKPLRKKLRSKRKEPLLKEGFFSVLFLLVSLGGSALYFFFFYPFFQVDEIMVGGAENLKEESLVNFVEEKIEFDLLSLSSKNILLFSSNGLRKEILDKTSVVRDVSVEKIFPAKLKLKFTQRIPRAVWCNTRDTDFCSYIDREGITFRKAHDIKKGSPVIVKEGDLSLGKKVIDSNHLERILLFMREAGNMGLETNYFHILDEKEVEAYMKERWAIRFTFEEIEREIENLRLVVRELNKKEIENLKYIDLRFGDRVYYK